MTTIVDVVDSAVKIGLGAAISGLATYVTMSAKSSQEIHRETIRRDREIIEEAAEQTERFTNVTLRLWGVAVDRLRYKEQGREISDDFENKTRAASSEILAAVTSLSSAEAKLLLLGHKESQILLREYGEFSIRFVRTNWMKVPDMDSEKLELKKQEILEMRRTLFESLSNDYRNLSEKARSF